MKVLKGVVRKAISLVPRSRALASCCGYYCELCREDMSGYEGNQDFRASGEKRLLQELAPHLKTVFDVGANVGEWTGMLLGFAPDAQVHAFEPSASAFAELTRRNFPRNVALHNIALSSKPGRAPLHVFGDSSGLNSLHNRHGLEPGWGISPASATEEVQLETVDSFCASHALPRVDLMKIDTEGHEVDVLLGSGESLASGTIRRVQFEYGGTYIDSRRLLKDAFDVFAPLDFAVFLIIGDGLLACPKYDQRLENFQTKNFIALHKDAIQDTPSAREALRRKR